MEETTYLSNELLALQKYVKMSQSSWKLDLVSSGGLGVFLDNNAFVMDFSYSFGNKNFYFNYAYVTAKILLFLNLFFLSLTFCIPALKTPLLPTTINMVLYSLILSSFHYSLRFHSSRDSILFVLRSFYIGFMKGYKLYSSSWAFSRWFTIGGESVFRSRNIPDLIGDTNHQGLNYLILALATCFYLIFWIGKWFKNKNEKEEESTLKKILFFFQFQCTSVILELYVSVYVASKLRNASLIQIRTVSDVFILLALVFILTSSLLRLC